MTRLTRPLIAAIAFVGLAGCGNKEGPPIPSAPLETLVRLVVDGPASIEPGGTGQFTATAHYSNGAVQNKSSEASWRTSDDSVLAISSTGDAVARARGEASVTASFGGRTSTKPEVLVLPAGTYRLRGIVRDSGIEVENVRVTVTENPAEGLSTTTRRGEYRLYGIAGLATIVVTGDGYVPGEHRINVTEHQTRDFNVVLARPREKVEGSYTLRVTAADSCRSTLPADLHVRSYTATVARSGPKLTVTLDGAAFYWNAIWRANANMFRGTVEPTSLKFQLWSADYYYYGYNPAVVETITTQRWYSPMGSASLTPSLEGYAGTLVGQVVEFAGSFHYAKRCHSTSHRIELIDPAR